MEKQALYNYLIHLADDSVVLAQRLCEWTGHGPFLEEDLALTNISLDVFGRARAILEYAAQLEGKGRTEDHLAFFRNEREYTNVLLAELPNGDYAKTMMRLAFMNAYDFLLYTELSKSTDATLAGIAAKAVKESIYHRRHSFSWIERFGNGTEESMNRLKEAFLDTWSFTGEMFESHAQFAELAKTGVVVDPATLKANWDKDIRDLLQRAGLTAPEGVYMHTGGRKGVHTEHLGHLLAEMQSLPRSLPEATW